MSVTDVLRHSLLKSDRFPVQARSGLPYFKEWVSDAGLICDATPIWKDLAPKVTRPTIVKLVDEWVVQSTQAQQIVHHFGARRGDNPTPATSVAQFNVILPDLAAAIIRASRTNPDIQQDLVNAAKLRWAVIRDAARVRAVPNCVAAHLRASTQELLNVDLTLDTALRDDPCVEKGTAKQIYDWVRAQRQERKGYFPL